MSERLFRFGLNFTVMREAAYHRTVKKRYWRERGLEVLQAIQDTPTPAQPVDPVRGY